MHVAAHDPSPVAIGKEDVPKDLIERERELFKRQALEEGKPEKVVEKIVDGRINKYFSEVCLLEQAFVKDPDRKVRDLLAEEMAQSEGSDLRITEFVRFRLGESSSP
jgi:elongation factor Ts